MKLFSLLPMLFISGLAATAQAAELQTDEHGLQLTLSSMATPIVSAAPSYDCPRWRCGYNTDSLGAVSFELNANEINAQAVEPAPVLSTALGYDCSRWRCGYNTESLGAVSFDLNADDINAQAVEPAPVISTALGYDCSRWRCGYNTESLGTVSFELNIEVTKD